MKVWLFLVGGLFVGAIVIDLLIARRRRRQLAEDDVSPRWLNENTYNQDGDDSWQ